MSAAEDRQALDAVLRTYFEGQQGAVPFDAVVGYELTAASVGQLRKFFLKVTTTPTPPPFEIPTLATADVRGMIEGRGVNHYREYLYRVGEDARRFEERRWLEREILGLCLHIYLHRGIVVEPEFVVASQSDVA